MEFFKQFSYKDNKNAWIGAFKVAGVVLAAIVVISLAGSILRAPISQFSSMMGVRQMGGYASSAPSFDAVSAPELSYRNVAELYPTPMPGTPSGTDAEAYEVTDYSAYFETRNLDSTCQSVLDLKQKEYVIFDSSNESQHQCSYSFKVEIAKTDEVLGLLKELNPKELSENSYTIKQQVTDFTSEEEIVKSKLASIESTLQNALRSYDEISGIATRSQNAEALAKIIDSKIGIIERLSLERVSLNERLDRLARAKADALDRLEYTHFSVSVQENTFFDLENIKDSWKTAIKDFVRSVNSMLQALTIGVVGLVLVLLQAVVYLFVVLFSVKYVWKSVVLFWKK